MSELPKLPANLTPDQRATAEEERLHIALRGLLADRFQLKLHHETKEMPAYALTVAKSGFKLKETSETAGCGTNSKGNGTSINFTATCVDMTKFASHLARVTRQPVADETHCTAHTRSAWNMFPTTSRPRLLRTRPRCPRCLPSSSKSSALGWSRKRFPSISSWSIARSGLRRIDRGIA